MAKKLKRKRKQELEQYEEFSNAEFAFIAGYTSGGVPYGLTHEEMKAIEEKSNKSRRLSTNNCQPTTKKC